MDELYKYIHRFIKLELKKANLEVLQSESGRVGVGFGVKNNSDKTFEIDVRILDLTVPRRDKKVKIPKSDWNYKLPQNLFVALVILLEGIEPIVYLIPSKVFIEPDNYIFFDNEQDQRFKHFSNWEIKIITNQIKEFEKKYGFNNQMERWK